MAKAWFNLRQFKAQAYLDGAQGTLDRLANSLYPTGMDTTNAAERRLRALDFWRKHGTEAAADAFGVTRSTLYRWKAAWKSSGGRIEALVPGSRKRASNNRRTVDPRVLAEAVRLRGLHPRLGKEKLLPLLAAFCAAQGVPERLSESRVGRMLGDLKRAGRLPDPSTLRTNGRTGRLHQVRRDRRPKLRRSGYRPSDPGDLVQVDTVVTFVDGVKRYTTTAVDCTSRFAFAWSHATGSSAAARDFFRRLEAVAPFGIRRVQTDNGSEFQELFRDHLQAAGVEHYFNYPRRPQQNGTVERFNRTIQEEFLSWHRQTLAYDLPEFNRLCCEWLLWYNGERTHHSLGATPLGYLIRKHGLSQNGWTHTQPCVRDVSGYTKWNQEGQLPPHISPNPCHDGNHLATNPALRRRDARLQGRRH